MTDRAHSAIKNASGQPGARAPLSSYMQHDSLETRSDGWTVFSSDQPNVPHQAPDVSILRQIKNFLCVDPRETERRSEGDAQNVRIEYPYYDAAPDDEPAPAAALLRVTPYRRSEAPPDDVPYSSTEPEVSSCNAELAITSQDVESSIPDVTMSEEPATVIDEESSSESEIERQEDRSEPEAATSVHSEIEDSQIEDSKVLTLGDVDESETNDAVPLNTEEIAVFQEVISEESEDSMEETSQEEKNNGATSVTPERCLLDADDLLGDNFQNLTHDFEFAPSPDSTQVLDHEPVVTETFVKESLTATVDVHESVDEYESTLIEPPSIDGAVTTSDSCIAISQQKSFDEDNLLEERRSDAAELVVVDAERHETPQRHEHRRRMPIFSRFVDLVAGKERKHSAPAVADTPIVQQEGVAAPDVSVELVLAPFYNDATLSTCIVAGRENTTY